jgi:hypothetical protein
MSGLKIIMVRVHGPELGPTNVDHNFNVLLTCNIASL